MNARQKHCEQSSEEIDEFKRLLGPPAEGDTDRLAVFPLGNSTLPLLRDFYRHTTEFPVNPAASPQRPPVIKIDLHGPPHGHPSGDCEALPRDGGPSSRLVTQQHLTEAKTHREEQQADEKTGTTLFQEALEFQVGNLGAVSKVVVYRSRDQFRRVR